MVSDIIECSWAATGLTKTQESPAIGMSPEVLTATDTLRKFLFERVYDIRSVQKESERAREVVRQLYGYFGEHEDEMPPEYRLERNDTERGVVDYIAGMTDQYALRKAEALSPVRGK